MSNQHSSERSTSTLSPTVCVSVCVYTLHACVCVIRDQECLHYLCNYVCVSAVCVSSSPLLPLFRFPLLRLLRLTGLLSSCLLCFSQVRKFVSMDSAGLRVRSHPSLQSEQIGIVQVNGTITFIDEVNCSRLGDLIEL